MRKVGSASDLRAEARKLLVNNWGHSAVMALLMAVMSVLIGAISDSILGSVFMSIIAVGFSLTFYELVLTKEMDSGFMGLFSAFTEGRAAPMLLTWLLATVWEFLWSLLLIVPGIIKALAYSQAYYIVKDEVAAGHSITATQAITKSRKMMNGHKAEYFYLCLTFIGWYLLALLTLGIGLLWLGPYFQTTKAVFYQRLKEQQDA